MITLNKFINNLNSGKELKELDLLLKTITFNYTNTLNLEVIMYLYRYNKLNKKPHGQLKMLTIEFMRDILAVTTTTNFGKKIGTIKIVSVNKTKEFFEYEAHIKTDLEHRKVRINRSNAKYILDENLLSFTPCDLYFNKHDKLYYIKPKGEKLYCQNLLKA